jgi:hypothetical protein
VGKVNKPHSFKDGKLRRPVAGFNDLATNCPESLECWDFERNQVLPEDVVAGSPKSFFWKCRYGHSFERSARDFVKRSSCPVCLNLIVLEGFNDLKTVNPALALEFDAELNSPLRVTHVTAVTTKVVYWKCINGHQWQAPVRRRNSGTGCPYCSNNKLDAKSNSLSSKSPKLVSEWDYTKNKPMMPEMVIAGSGRKYWWLCDKGHSWKAAVYRRVEGRGCIYCSNRELLKGFNDLKSVFPELAKEWDKARNKKKANEVLYGTNKQAWWICQMGHSYKSPVSKRTLSKSGCPYCANKKVLVGFNDLQSQMEEFAKRWSPANKVKPSEVLYVTQKKYQFLCELGHTWSVQPNTVKNSSYCPTCSNKEVEVGFNDLITRFPYMAETYSPEHNQGLDLRQVDPRSKKKLTWNCSRGHTWQASPAGRIGGKGCPVCANLIAWPGFNDLKSKFPDISAQWDIQKNVKPPEEIVAGSNAIYWWVCEFGHEYRQSVSNKTGKNYGCPICSNKQLLQGFNDLATTQPELISEWHKTRNGKITPKDLTAGSSKRIWWQCSEGHEWPAAPSTRTKGIGCPTCNRGGFDPSREGYVYFLRNFELRARKVGITNTDSPRLSNFEKFGWSAIQLFHSQNGHVIRETETQFFRWLRKEIQVPRFLTKEQMYPMRGESETFALDEPSDFQIITKISELIESSRKKLGST